MIIGNEKSLSLSNLTPSLDYYSNLCFFFVTLEYGSSYVMDQHRMQKDLQVQKDFPTVEGELFKAMAECGYISEDDILSPVRFAFQRAARTDRSVSAARQVHFK